MSKDEFAPVLDPETGVFDYNNFVRIDGIIVDRSTLPPDHYHSLDSYFSRYNLDKVQVLQSNARIFITELSEFLPKDQELAIKNALKV